MGALRIETDTTGEEDEEDDEEDEDEEDEDVGNRMSDGICAL